MSEIRTFFKNLKTPPFLFIGSGLSRRYLGLPDWETLLYEFANKINIDKLSYQGYMNKAKLTENPFGNLPKIAELIEKDFNLLWFDNPAFRGITDKYLDSVKNGASPFKAEIANYIVKQGKILTKYNTEIAKLKEISVKSISGAITTNYDCLLEDTLGGYKLYVGQEELIFSPIQGIAEIYKIHGSVTDPTSIVITEKDYIKFDNNSEYLAAKLLTLFLEYPIVFIGYSISDKNVQDILESMVKCLSPQNMGKLQDRFVFVEYDARTKGKSPKIQAHTISFGGKVIGMTKIVLESYLSLFDAIAQTKTTLPAKMLRLFKEEFYKFTITNEPTTHLKLALMEDTRIDDNDLVMAIGTASEFGYKGLRGVTGNDWYRDIILNDLEFSADDILEYAYPVLRKSNQKMPLYKYLFNAKRDHFDCENPINCFDDIISNTTKKMRNSKVIVNRSVSGVLRDYTQSIAIGNIAYLTESEINICELEKFLSAIFGEDPTILEGSMVSHDKSNLRRLIRIYDYLKYSKKRRI